MATLRERTWRDHPRERFAGGPETNGPYRCGPLLFLAEPNLPQPSSLDELDEDAALGGPYLEVEVP